MPRTRKHKVFISYHHKNDQQYKDELVSLLRNDLVDKSVHDDDIDDRNIKTVTIRQKIRDDFIADATVTVVLVGPETCTRKHVDWEIGSSLRKTKKNSRCGMLGIVLPNHPDYGKKLSAVTLIPPRLADNIRGDDPYAKIYHWPKSGSLLRIRGWIDTAFQRRNGTPPKNGRKPFKNNRTLRAPKPRGRRRTPALRERPLLRRRKGRL